MNEQKVRIKRSTTLFNRARASVFLFICAMAGVLLCGNHAHAQPVPSGEGSPTNTPLNSWSFYDTTNWTSDYGYAPVSFTNIYSDVLGSGTALVVDTNLPAWLQYNVYESDGSSNLTVDSGAVTFWFAPDWASTNLGGTGPGVYGRLFEVGSNTPDSSYGWWSIYVDDGGNNLYFSAQTNDLSSNITTYLSYPISWTNDYFHFVAVTYCPTNTALYLDGVLATNGPGMTLYPGTDVLSNGFYLGSDGTGLLQSHGYFNTVQTYNYPLDTNDISTIFNWYYPFYIMSPWNVPMVNFGYVPSVPSYQPTFDAITGAGDLLWLGNTASCLTGTTPYTVWITNITATAGAGGTMNVTFSIQGGADGIPFDVFANSVLSFGTNGVPWTWLGQGYHCNTYMLTGLSNSTCFLILGTPQDTSGQGLTDAYENLVAKVSPGGAQTDGYGVPYAWYALNGLVPITNGLAIQDPDQDALLNYKEYQYGTKPTVSEGFSIWTTIGTTSIP